MWVNSFILVSFSIVSLFGNAWASDGGGSSGGGDLCEARIQAVAADIQNWIALGGPKELSLSQNLSVDQYSEKMLQQLKIAKISCVGAGDPGYPVLIDSVPKVCRFDLDSNGSQITCDLAKFQALTESEQYVLLHHEYAGLAGVEAPRGEVSSYEISNQLSEFLVDQVVKKLGLKSPTSIKPALSPGVQRFRDEFTKGTIPTAKDLHLGKVLMCFETSGNYGENDGNGFRIKIEKSGKFYRMSYVGMSGSSLSENPEKTKSIGFLQHMENTVWGAYLRMSLDGNLLMEGTREVDSAKEYEEYPRSIANPSHIMIHPSMCEVAS